MLHPAGPLDGMKQQPRDVQVRRCTQLILLPAMHMVRNEPHSLPLNTSAHNSHAHSRHGCIEEAKNRHMLCIRDKIHKARESAATGMRACFSSGAGTRCQAHPQDPGAYHGHPEFLGHQASQCFPPAQSAPKLFHWGLECRPLCQLL